MKRTYNINIAALFLVITATAFGQVGIGTTTVAGSGILDFGSEDRGIVLPWVTDTVGSQTSTTNGTLLFDVADLKVKVLANGAWEDLSQNRGTIQEDSATEAKLMANALKTEVATATVYIGAQTLGNEQGVLVLEAADKALILPKMASPQTAMMNPEPGTLVYDTTDNLVCVYNGSEWTFWGI